jgi:hypothetical protein
MLRGVGLVQLREQVEVRALMLARDASGRREVEDGRTFRAQRRALKAGGQVAIAPVK